MESGPSNFNMSQGPSVRPARTTCPILSRGLTMESGSGASTDDGEDIRDLRCCFNSCHIRTGSVVIALLESLLLFQSIIYLAVNLATGEKRYASMIPDFAQVIKYEYFVPMIVLQSLWIVGNIVAVFAVKYITPGLIIVQLVLRTPAALANLIIAILFIVNAATVTWEDDTADWALVLTLSVYISTTVMTIYFTYVTWMCLKHLKHFKKIIAAQRFWIETPTTVTPDEHGRRSITPLRQCGHHGQENCEKTDCSRPQENHSFQITQAEVEVVRESGGG